MRTTGGRTYGILAGSAFVGCLLLASATWAGRKQTQLVSISTAARYAEGSLANARATADGNASIGCHIYNTGIVTCFAKNASGTASLSCTTFDPLYRAAAQSLSGDSHLYFSADAGGNCSSLIVENYSHWAPKEL